MALHGNSTTEMPSIRKDKQHTYNVIMRSVLATIAAVEEQRLLHNLSVFL
jgi:hypothetical protein